MATDWLGVFDDDAVRPAELDDPIWLAHHYTDLAMSARAIADRLGVSETPVEKALKKYGIPRRTAGRQQGSTLSDVTKAKLRTAQKQRRQREAAERQAAETQQQERERAEAERKRLRQERQRVARETREARARAIQAHECIACGAFIGETLLVRCEQCRQRSEQQRRAARRTHRPQDNGNGNGNGPQPLEDAQTLPLEILRTELETMRAEGASFDTAWRLARHRALHGRDASGGYGWADVINSTRPAWLAAFTRSGTQPGGGLASLA